MQHVFGNAHGVWVARHRRYHTPDTAQHGVTERLASDTPSGGRRPARPQPITAPTRGLGWRWLSRRRMDCSSAAALQGALQQEWLGSYMTQQACWSPAPLLHAPLCSLVGRGCFRSRSPATSRCAAARSWFPQPQCTSNAATLPGAPTADGTYAHALSSRISWGSCACNGC